MLTIRPASVDDAPAIGRVHVQVWRETYPGIVPQRVLDEMNIHARTERWRSVLAETPASHFYWCAFDGADLIGYIGCGPARYPTLGLPAEVFMINILKSGQNRGGGRALMQHAARSLMSSCFQSAGLWVFVENHNARAFYRRLGGVETEIRHNVEFDGDSRPEMAVHWADLRMLAYPSTGT